MVEHDPEIERVGRTAVVHLRGDLVVATTPELDALLVDLARRSDLELVQLDCHEVGRFDASAVAAIDVARRTSRARIELVHLQDRARQLMEATIDPPASSAAPPARMPWLEQFGEVLLGWGRNAGALWSLAGQTGRTAAAALFRRTRLPAGAMGEQLATAGTAALPIVSLLSFLLGMSLAYQGAFQLKRFGATTYVADFISVAMVREFAPLLTGIIVTGRSGAAIAAELGTMRVGSELDALDAMGINPVRFLVVPRVAALAIVEPILTLTSMFIGMLGGLFVCVVVWKISPALFWQHAIDRLTMGDFAKGLIKSVVFAWIIGLTSTHLGLRTNGGASEVGRAATRAVVTAVFWIVVFDATFETALTMVTR
jgi:phospholipid/cholesterol/gamma-HCH transport system permease protein